MKTRGRTLLAGGAAVVVLGAGVWWRAAREPAIPVAWLPPAPALTERPAQLADLIADAEARARSPRTALEGVAELGRLYHANGFTAEAETCWRALHAARPKEARWAYLLADARHTLGDPEEFEARLHDTVRLDPRYAPAWLKLAELAFKTGRTDEAVAHYHQRLGLLPGDPYARLGLARALRQQGDREKAAQAIADLVRDHPDFPPAHNLHAETLAAQGDLAGARRHRWLGRESGRFREADDPWLHELNAWCHDPKRLAVLGTAEFQLAQGDRGFGLIERAVRIAPNDPGGHELLGDLLLKLGRPSAARDSLTTALSLRAANDEAPPVETYLNLVEALQQLGQAAEALRRIEEGFRRCGDRFELHLARGVVLDGLDRLVEAETALREAVLRAPQDADAHYNLALVLLQRERHEEATRHLRLALSRQPTFPKALALLAQLALEEGRVAEAGAYVRPLYEANPGQPEVQALAAYWHLQSGLAASGQRNVAVAERHYRDGLEAQPDNVDLLISLGALLVGQHRGGEAEVPLQEYRRLRPNEGQGAMLVGEAWLQTGRTEEARRVLEEGERLARNAGQTQIAQRCRELLGR